MSTQSAYVGGAKAKPIAAVSKVSAASRLLFVDNIRVFLTVLVLLHHLMITYTGNGGWYYREGRQDFITDALGGWFCATNQAYFMGLFLLISAYFVPGSCDRRGVSRFLKDRFIRLGIPLAIYSWIINPLFVYAINYGGLQMPFRQFFTRVYFSGGELVGQGPLWFVEVLLIFSLVYGLWRALAQPAHIGPEKETAFPGNGIIALFALLLGIAGFLVRLVFMMDAYTFRPLNLQFPFFAQYIALFILGLVAFRRNWLVNLPDQTGRLWLGIAVVLVILWAPLMVLGGAIEDDLPFKGGWHWQSFVYTLWEACLCVSMCIGMIYFFRRYFNQRGRIAAFLAPNAYTAYLIHAPLITFTALLVRDVSVYPLLKWVMVALVSVPLCFVFAGLVRKLPYTERVL